MFWMTAAILGFPWLLGLMITCTMEGERDSEQGRAEEDRVHNRRRRMTAPPRDTRRFPNSIPFMKEEE